MKTKLPIAHSCLLLAGIVGASILSGCMTRSISDSAYRGEYGGWYHSQVKELSEFSVLGINPDESITDQDISAQYTTRAPLKWKKGAGILLIQSGAMFPDEPMQRELAKSFRVGPFSGIANDATSNYSKALRLGAAQGGYDYILCYWGVLEASQKTLATKSVSWVPVLGRAIPDETQEMRIRLKAFVVDARTGQ
ncbi:MAG: aminopeptidase, partial [Pedosphaera parvula]|nr:aminopeptidase [Pedosphaera parvula]